MNCSGALHVAFVITRGDAVGGATIHVRDMARMLIASGHRATVLVGGEGEVLREFDRCGIPYRSVKALQRSIHPVLDAVALAQLANALRGLKPDLVSAHTAKAGLLGRVAARLAGIPVIFTPHGWAITDRISAASGRVFRVAERLAAPLAKSIVNVCEAERRLAKSHGIGQDDRLSVIHNGVFDVPRSLMAMPSADPPRLIMVARHEAPKDYRILIEALSDIQHLPWSAEFVGGGPALQETKRLAETLGVEQRIQFCGTSSNVAEHLAACQLFVLTSNSEGFPRSILEAMRAGLPVVASDVGGVSEAVLNGTTGLVVPRSNRAVLRDAVATMIGSSTLRARFGRAARLRYESHFTFNRMYEKTFDLYQKVLSRRAGRVPAPLEGM